MESDQTRQWPSWLWWVRYLHEPWVIQIRCKNIHCTTKTYSTAGLNIKVSTSRLWNGGWGAYFSVTLLVFTENTASNKSCVQWVFYSLYSSRQQRDGGLSDPRSDSTVCLKAWKHFLSHFWFHYWMGYIIPARAATSQLLISVIIDYFFRLPMSHLVYKISNSSEKYCFPWDCLF